MNDLIDSDLEHYSMSEAFQNYKKLKTHNNPNYNVSASDWTMAWNYAREFYLGIAYNRIRELEQKNKNLYELSKNDVKLLNKLDAQLEELQKQLAGK